MAERAPIPQFPTPSDRYNGLNEAEFRRELGQSLEDITELAASLSGLVAHASTHQSGGSDILTRPFLITLGTHPDTDYAGGGATGFLGVVGVSPTDRFRVQLPVGLLLTVTDIYVSGRDPGGAETYTATLMRNGASTTEVVTIAGGSSTGSNTGISEAYIATDEIWVQLTSSGTCPAIWTRVTLVCRPTT